VLDFGISKALLSAGGEGVLTTTSSFVGSPIYAPPEQLVRAHDVDTRADIWSLGTILFEALSGRPPFVGDSVMHVASRIFNEAPTPLAELRPDLPPELCEAVMRCLRKKPAERFQDVHELAQALAAFAPSHSISAERIARIVASSRSPSQLAALADTAHAVQAGSGETPHALVSASTPAPSATRKWIIAAATAGAVGAVAIVVGLAAGRGPSGHSGVEPRPTVVAAAVTNAPGSPVASVSSGQVAPLPAASEPAPLPLPSAASASASASAPPVAHPMPQLAPAKKNPLSVSPK
jgi:serine/threonine-protein kinase